MNIVAHSKFEVFAEKFVRAYWETVKSSAFSVPPDEPVHETIEKLLSEISHETEVRRVSDREGGLHLLHMKNSHGDGWCFTFRAGSLRWELVGASASSDSETSHDLFGPVYSQHFAPFLRHVERVANETKRI